MLTELDPLSTELEVQDFIYGLIRLVKPHLVVETGCYVGHLSHRICLALAENGTGRLITCDTEPQCVKVTSERLAIFDSTQVLPLSGVKALESLPTPPDIVILDSGKGRVEEAQVIRSLGFKCYVLLHDAYGDSNQAHNVLSGWWPYVGFRTGRGLAIYQT